MQKSAKRTWVVYGLYADRALQYVGITQNPTRRRSRHAIDLMAGREFNMRTLTRAGSRQDAEAIEADYIRKRHPPLNTAHRDRPKQTITHVRTFWIDHGGERRECTMRLRPGTMHPDEAREIWHHGSGQAGDRIALMPGWTLDRAYRAFGKYGDEAAVDGINADPRMGGMTVSVSQALKVLKGSGRRFGRKPIKS